MLVSKAVLRGSTSVMGLRRIPLAQAPYLQLASRQFCSLRPSIRPQIPVSSRALLPLATLRFNSSLPTTTTLPTPEALTGAQAAGTIPAHTLPDSLLSDYTPTTEFLTPTVITEHVGFLKELGLDYGFGPTALLQNLLENAHVLSSTPWWASIILTVLIVRVAQFPFYMRMSETTARMKEVNPQVVPLTKKMREAQLSGDKVRMIAIKQAVTEVYRKAGVNRLWIAFPITQIPIFYGFYKNLFGMAELKVPGLVEGGNWWFHDLTVADPYYILPLVSSMSMGLQILLGGEAGTTLQTRRMKQGMVMILPVVSFTFVHSWPAALTLYFCANSLWGLFQANLLRNAWVREKLGLYPLDTTAKNPLARDALNIATEANPMGKVVDVTATAQIGGRGGFLDKITGGDVKTDGKKKSWADRILGEEVKGEGGGIRERIKETAEKNAHKAYEKKRLKRLEQEEEQMRERKRRSGIIL